MYWWNLQAVKRELTGEPLTSRQLLPYLLAVMVLEALVVEFSFLGPSSQDLGVRQWAVASASVVVTVFGCLYIYRQNGGASGTRLLERFLVLGWVTGIRVTVVVFFAFLILLFLADQVPTISEGLEKLSDIAIELLVLIYYVYLGHHVGSLARPQSAA